jgi:hypothetical protein
MSLVASKVWAARNPKSPGTRAVGEVVAAAWWNPGQSMHRSGLWIDSLDNLLVQVGAARVSRGVTSMSPRPFDMLPFAALKV